MSEPSHYGARLRQLRHEAKMTQDELSAKSGLHRQMIAKLELGLIQPGWRTAQLLAAALGARLDDFADPAIMPAPPRPRGRPRKAGSDAKGR